MRRRILAAVGLAAGVGCSSITHVALAADAGTDPSPNKTTAAKGAPREIKWEELVPKDWDPTKLLRDKNVGRISDGDPEAFRVMKEIREIWDNAPANPEMDGASVKLAGYVVPLEQSNDGVKELLLVPYFGACIHMPPPPSNQILHVFASRPAQVGAMEIVWVSGRIRISHQKSYMGTSGYTMDNALVELYEDKSK